MNEGAAKNLCPLIHPGPCHSERSEESLSSPWGIIRTILSHRSILRGARPQAAPSSKQGM